MVARCTYHKKIASFLVVKRSVVHACWAAMCAQFWRAAPAMSKLIHAANAKGHAHTYTAHASEGGEQILP